MAINFQKVKSDLVKIYRGLGYTIQMMDDAGSVVSSSNNAKYIYLEPDGIMITFPDENGEDFNELNIYTGKEKDKYRFIELVQQSKRLCHFNGLGIQIKNLDSTKATPKSLLHKAKAYREENLD